MHDGAAKPLLRIPSVLAMLLLLLAGSLASCGRQASVEGSQEVHFVATIQPIYLIVRELAEGRATVSRLMDPGASPHTYDPRPSDVRAVERAAALIHVSNNIDGWAARLPARAKVSAFDHVPPSMRLHYDADGHICDHGHDHHHHHHHSDEDGHFWTDPIAVREILVPLAGEFARLDPEGADVYLANARRMEARLSELHDELALLLMPVMGRRCILFHPSFNYMFTRYGIEVAAVVEPSPGQEASPAWLRDIIRTAAAEDVKAIFSEPQLSQRPAEVLAEATGLPLHEIDPIGVRGDLTLIDDFLLHNGRILREALE